MANLRHDNRVLIRSGEARLVGWSRQMLYSGFNNLPRSVFWSADLNGRSDNTDVISLKNKAPLFRHIVAYEISSKISFCGNNLLLPIVVVELNSLVWGINKAFLRLPRHFQTKGHILWMAVHLCSEIFCIRPSTETTGRPYRRRNRSSLNTESIQVSHFRQFNCHWPSFSCVIYLD